MNAQLDHILLGVPDLEAASAAFAAITGVMPAVGGSHPGFGTRNRLVAIGPDAFLELIGPDPAQTMAAGSRAAEIAAMAAPALITFAVQTTDMAATAAAAATAGLVAGASTAMSRTRPDGVRLAWTVAHFGQAGMERVVPFAIDWQGSPHPATTSPTGCVLRHLTVLHPEAAKLTAIYAGLGVDIMVRASLRPGFVLLLDTPHGEVCLTS